MNLFHFWWWSWGGGGGHCDGGGGGGGFNDSNTFGNSQEIFLQYIRS